MSTLKQTLQKASMENALNVGLLYKHDVATATEYALVLVILFKLFKDDDCSHDLSILKYVSEEWTIPVSITTSPRDVLKMLQSHKIESLDEIRNIQKYFCENLQHLQNPSLSTLPHIFKTTIKKSFRCICSLFENGSCIKETSTNIEQLLECIKRFTQITQYGNK